MNVFNSRVYTNVKRGLLVNSDLQLMCRRVSGSNYYCDPLQISDREREREHGHGNTNETSI